MKKLYLCILIYLGLNVAWGETDYLSARGYASNKICVAEIMAMENAVAFIGGSDDHPYPHATYTVLFKDENSKYTLNCFETRHYRKKGDFEKLSIYMLKEGEEPRFEYSLDEVDANLLLNTLAEQISLAEEKGFNDEDKLESFNVYEVGLKVGDNWVFAGQKDNKSGKPVLVKKEESPEDKYELDRYSIARKLMNLYFSPSQTWAERDIKSLAYDYRPLARESLKNTLIDFGVERDRQYFGVIDFDKDETKASFALSTRAKKCHFKLRTLKNVFKIKLYPKEDPDEIQIYASINRNGSRGNVGMGKFYKFDRDEDYKYLYESEHLGNSKINTEFLSVLQLRADANWESRNAEMERGDPICFSPSTLSTGGLLGLIGISEKNTIIKYIDKKINPPIARWKGSSNGEFSEAFGVVTFKDKEMIDSWIVHINTGHTSLLSFEDGEESEKSVYDISFDFDAEKRRYSSLKLNIKDKSGTVSYMQDDEEVDALNYEIAEKYIKKHIEILSVYKSQCGQTRVIFAGKIIP